MKSNYYSLLDILRFVAAAFVMLFHYFSNSLAHNDDLLSRLIVHGYMGVELFFIISGFVIYNSLRLIPDSDKLDWRAYLQSRFLRLYPLFWILCSITYLLTITIGQEHLPFYKYLLNLLIINNGQTANMIDGSYWTLTIEILFYIYIGLYSYIIGKKYIPYFLAGWLGYAYLSFYIPGLSEILLSKILLVRYAPYFIFGASLSYILEQYFKFGIIYTKHSQLVLSFKNFKIYLSILLLPLSYIATHYFSYKLNLLKQTQINMTNMFGVFNNETLTILNYIFLIFIITTLSSIYIRNTKLIRALQYIGLATYPLYLIHQKIGYLFISQWSEFGIINRYSISTAIIMILISLYIGVIDQDLRLYLSRIISGWRRTA